MTNTKNRGRGLRAGVLLAAAAVTAGPLLADGGVTFTDVAAGGGAGVTYQRYPTPGRLAILEALYAAPQPTPIPGGYTQRTPQKPYGSPGLALFDYDRDNDVDVYVTNGPGHANSLFQNQFSQSGQVTFVDVAGAAGVGAAAQDSAGVCYGDLDNDGDDDLYVTGIGEPNILFRNNGNGTFTDITAAAGAGAGTFRHAGCAMGDFNGDGRLDLLVANTYDNWNHRIPLFTSPIYPGMEPNQLFLQGPGTTFTDASVSSGIRNLVGLPDGKSFTWSVSAVDYDQDGDTDILWADDQGSFPVLATNQRGWIRLFENDGTGHFTDETFNAGLATGAWHSLSFGDFNCDGHLDLHGANQGYFVGAGWNQTRWFFGSASGTFTDSGIGSLGATLFGWGTATSDYDNDGDQDTLLYGDEDLFTVYAQDNQGTIYRNSGLCTGDFAYELDSLTTDHRFRRVNGLAVGDLNNDGFQDIVTVAMLDIAVTPILIFPFPLGPSPPQGSPVDDDVIITLVMGRTPAPPPFFLIYQQPPISNGGLAIEMNSGGNGNASAAVKLVGGSGLVAGGKSNRSGIGATVRFQPDGGVPVLAAVDGGGEHASESSRLAHFGLGSAAKGTVEVLWPGGTRNRLYDVAAGEQVQIPEIPCSFNGNFKNFGQYNSCVRTALNQYMQAGVINAGQRQRLIDSAVRAFNEQ